MDILQVPHLILKYIISHLDTVDKICFVISSKRWYEERSSYLTLPIDDMMRNPSDFNRCYIFMKSFLEQMHITERKKIIDPYYDIDQLSQLIKGISNTVTHLRFGPNFNDIIPPNLIPNHITHLHFGYDFNQELKLNLIPSSCVFLQFGHEFNSKIQIGAIPESVTKLIFGYDFNQKLQPGMIPIGVKYLKFGDHFVQGLELGTLPQTITHLEFGYFYNGFIKKNILPSGLTHLTFGGYYNQSLPKGRENLRDLIPSSTHTLELGAYFNSFTTKSLLSTIKYLRFTEDNEMGYTKVVPKGFLLSSIDTLCVPTQFFQHNSLETISSHIKNIIIEKDGEALHIRLLSKDYALALTKNVIGGFISTKQLNQLVNADIMTIVKKINAKLFK
ncbi:hypothetical 97.7 kDa protein [Heterostelium album PN500]|uniref:Hypothetical 97.7 kDa protein n=1 Tax=Heterostelium pallidum (strain ATCC 26659 / Pp 5 / PN500) TaxID=670386 RepID=D3AXS6_HETP5|nr:hypothetical 97.7 kDa protein [Heterostelium album PN500]EFA85753.1 hypothetical 97.7 kDa protein [Heterostelium album PN500]|eukprot:XP_020437859.1 hypothetical 97.7 kDa protein [Heterostelium album PN500]